MTNYITRNYSTKRENKGSSIILFPDNYVMIDTETTGLDPRYDEIIELSALKIKNNEVVDTYTTLVKPSEPISSFISELTGITNEMVKDAPILEETISSFISFVGEDKVMGYNAHFDVNFIYDAAQKNLNQDFSNDIIDVLRIARKIVKDSKNHKLKTIADYYDISYDLIHRGEADSLLCLACYTRLKTEALKLYGSEEMFINSFNKKSSKPKVTAIQTTKIEFDTEHPLYEKECVFTGTLSHYPRREAMQLVVDYGGTNRNSVTKKTNYLILGDTDYSRVFDGKSSKQKKAEKYKLGGQEIEIISEKVFYDMLVL